MRREKTDERLLRITAGLLALQKSRGGPLQGVFCDGSSFRVQYDEFGRRYPISWDRAEELIRNGGKRRTWEKRLSR